MPNSRIFPRKIGDKWYRVESYYDEGGVRRQRSLGKITEGQAEWMRNNPVPPEFVETVEAEPVESCPVERIEEAEAHHDEIRTRIWASLPQTTQEALALYDQGLGAMFNALLALTRICPEHLAQLLRATDDLNHINVTISDLFSTEDQAGSPFYCSSITPADVSI